MQKQLFTKAIAGYVVFLFFIFSIDFLYKNFSPMAHWLTYMSVAPASPSIEIGERMFFQSTRQVSYPAKVDWLDILYCEVSGVDGVYFSAYESSGILNELGIKTTKWQYLGELPDFPTACYLQSNVTLVLDYGIRKTQTLVGQPFNIR